MHHLCLLLRSHSGPHREEVRVQLLDQTQHQSSSHDAPGLRRSSHDSVGVSGVQMEAGRRSDDTNTTAALMRVCVICHLNNTKSVVACQYFLCVLCVFRLRPSQRLVCLSWLMVIISCYRRKGRHTHTFTHTHQSGQ